MSARDVIADLRTDYPPWMEDEQPGEVIATYKAERIRAAAALAAKDAEMREHQKALAAERADVAAALAEARDKLDAQDAEIAALRARLAAKDAVVEALRAWQADKPPHDRAREDPKARSWRNNNDRLQNGVWTALAAYNAAKEASDE